MLFFEEMAFYLFFFNPARLSACFTSDHRSCFTNCAKFC